MIKKLFNANNPKLLRNALPIKNPEVLSFIKKTDKNNFFFKAVQDPTIKDKFLSKYFKWIQTSKLNKLKGLGKFEYP